MNDDAERARERRWLIVPCRWHVTFIYWRMRKGWRTLGCIALAAAASAACSAAGDESSGAGDTARGALAAVQDGDSVGQVIAALRIADSVMTVAAWEASHPGDTVRISLHEDSLPACGHVDRAVQGRTIRIHFITPRHAGDSAAALPALSGAPLARATCVTGAGSSTLSWPDTSTARWWARALEGRVRSDLRFAKSPESVADHAGHPTGNRVLHEGGGRWLLTEVDTTSRVLTATYVSDRRWLDVIRRTHGELVHDWPILSEDDDRDLALLSELLAMAGADNTLGASLRGMITQARGRDPDPQSDAIVRQLLFMLLHDAAARPAPARAATYLAAHLVMGDLYQRAPAISVPRASARDSLLALVPGAFSPQRAGGDSLLRYDGDLEAEAVRLDTGRVRDIYLLTIFGTDNRLRDPFEGGADDWEDIIRYGEPLLRRLTAPREQAYLHALLGESYMDIVAQDRADRPHETPVTTAEARRRAIEHYRKAISLEPRSARARRAWAELWALTAGLTPERARHQYYH